ncbi:MULTISPECIES: tRNA1(Val) (adenine(37)-N6)-methyltransferase [unclassified Enterococcus]|uniref:tRNA1(Val) (adenine(37)-N6)-methyltransferase n=1 Tax=unclassified Enterococcus TaxID=2608891 RepID=UPI001CE1AEB2|nr:MULTISPECIES: tRNA1(Val) (adenine(37)-N6)-methyltransferase [unclassified Enterococcus]MCA5011696.1 tRNA1(Val) (adenine(37)-N6)-methyltransferase [Enterococcus sp. S23]MCA5014862.1 tRNA1(Val) (adenine(37)-N6)-methyltransferase [Enterococcus sp. S22(2020)]
MLLPGERIDQLFADDIQIIQSKEVFSFSIDAVLLANFPKLPKKGVVVDLCAGNGAVGLFASRKTDARIIQIELQTRLANMGQRSIQLNQLEQQMTMIELDLKKATTAVKPDSVDLVLCNPPYFKELPTSQKNPNPHLAIARHEIHTTLTEVVEVSSKLLKTNGRLAMVHRPDRFLDILHAMEAADIAPKRVRFVYPKVGKEANALLIEGIKQGKKDGFRVLSPLFTYDEENNYLPEMKAMLYGN